MRHLNWQISLAFILILLSTVLYLIHYGIFGDAHHIFIYLLGDIAFVPIEVLLVTVIIHQLLEAREKRILLKKMNMVIGTFFSEVGTTLLKMLSEFDEQSGNVGKELLVSTEWADRTFAKTSRRIKGYDNTINLEKSDLEGLKRFLKGKRGFLLGLLENPNLLEHDAFTDLLWAVFHATDELVLRKDINNLSHNDAAHISVDIKRAYSLLIIEWLAYMKHLKEDYPFLFSFAMRTNPFDLTASPEIS